MSAAAAPRAASTAGWTASPGRVLGLLALWLLATAWIRPLLLPDEGRYAEVAREMLAGDGMVPLLHGLPFFHKPPLTYWVDMAGMALLGVWPFTARLGPMLGAWLMGAALWLALRRLQGPRAAGAALLVLATSPFWFIGGQYANHDMLVAGTITVAVLCMARALESGAPERRWLLAGWAACGLAVLSKGLIGVVLPALVIGPWLLAQGRWRDLLRLLHPTGLAVFAAVALPWMLLMEHRYPGFFDYFVVDQHFRRYATTGFNNAQPWWFLLGVLPLLTLPWSLTLPVALRRVWRDVRPGAGDPGLRRWASLMAWWALVVLLFFSLPQSKLVGYIMPALAPWCALLAAPLAGSRWLRPIAAAAALLSVGVVLALAWMAPKSNADIGRALGQALRPGDRVVMVEDTFHDVAFVARLAAPPLVASNWADPDIRKRDNWRKELADTARFDPAAAAARLVPVAELPALVCQGRRVWFVAHDAEAAALMAPVPGAIKVLQGRRAQLWRADPRPCAGGG